MKRRSITVLVSIMLLLGAFVKPGNAQTAPSCTGPSISDSGPGFPGDINVYAGQVFTFTSKATAINPGSQVIQFVMSGTFIGQPFTVTGVDTVTFTGIAPTDGVWRITSGFTQTSGSVGTTMQWSYSAACPADLAAKIVPLFTDGRLNNNDAHESAAIYCEGGGVTVYVPGDPKWLKAFHASAEEINKVSKNPAENTLIKQGRGARLYRLTSGKLQLNAPELDPTKDDYTFIFEGCS